MSSNNFAIAACAVILVCSFSGCTGGIQGAIESMTHGDPEIIESSVETTSNLPFSYTASKTITITNDFAGADMCALNLNMYGNIQLNTWNENGYKFIISVQGQGSTSSEALENLNSITIDSQDEFSSGTLNLSVVSSADDGDWTGKSAEISAFLPSEPQLFIATLTAASGEITVNGVHGNMLAASVAMGSIEISGDISILSAGKAMGNIDVTSFSTSSGSCFLYTAYGQINLKVMNGPEYGYNVTAETGIGTVDIQLSNTEASGEQSQNSKHVITVDYDSKEIQILVGLSCMGGGTITVDEI
ncbi:MAG: DUF4097 family beta strand repeat-containing protein [Candidatus Thermoplasmatota archaeon]|nr:DUF4097 family beta strand repeat-containing protein [Candidatus Thermoplasmatota archaeon]